MILWLWKLSYNNGVDKSCSPNSSFLASVEMVKSGWWYSHQFQLLLNVMKHKVLTTELCDSIPQCWQSRGSAFMSVWNEARGRVYRV